MIASVVSETACQAPKPFPNAYMPWPECRSGVPFSCPPARRDYSASEAKYCRALPAEARLLRPVCAA